MQNEPKVTHLVTSNGTLEPVLPMQNEPQLSAEMKHLKSSECGLWKTDKHPFDFFMFVYSEARERWENPDDFNEYMPELLKQAIKNNFWQEGDDADASESTTIRKEIKEAIRYLGVNKKTCGGWVSEVTNPIADEIIEILLRRVKNMNIGVGAVPLIKNLIWELEAK